MPGKVDDETLATAVFGRTGATDDRILQGPAIGEDAAAIDVPAGTLLVSSDPISLAAIHVGTLGVHVACNDVAAAGGDPTWLTVTCLLPSDDATALETIVSDLHDAASAIDVSIVGGHTEYVDTLERPILSLTALGFADPHVPTGGANPGDRIVLAGPAGLEGTAVLANDFGETLDVPAEDLEDAEAFLEAISVLPAARAIRAHASAMTDPTEGGVAGGLVELATASGVHLAVERDSIPVRSVTERLCDAAGVDPLRIFGSGALLATVPPDVVDMALDALADVNVEGSVIGTVSEGDRPGGTVELDGEPLETPVEDDLYALWENADG